MALFNKLLSTASAVDYNTPIFPHGIKVWHDPGEADVDIVFVHGLTGDRERTWTHQSASEPWPKTLLPLHLPSSRILAFGYDAYIVKKGAAVSNQLVDHSKDFLNSLTSLRDMTESSARPLIFVGHSLGGLVCKDAILQSRNNPEPHLRNIFQSTMAIAFLGTPHGGSDLASWARIPAKALGVFKSINTDLLSILPTSSEVLYRIQNDFLSMVRDIREQDRSLKITCFWESLPMPYVGTIVTRPSASLAGYNAISIHANHRDMVKFGIAGDPGFISVVGELRRWVRDVGYSTQIVSTADVSAKDLRQEKMECLKSLTFAEIGSRKSNIDSPNPETCEWIFNDSSYELWDTPNSGPGSRNLLWIKGKPGSGKSTLMKRITLEHDKKSLTGSIFCLSFFFNARGAKLENSPLGLYRTLLFQLLQNSKALMEDFLPRFLQNEKQCQGEQVTWQTPEISKFFHSAISEVQSRPTYIFIDALDECEEYELRKIIKRLEDCSAAAVSNGAILKICLSSRHYPHISLRTVTGQEIFMEDHNGLDIRRYVHQELNLREPNLRAELTVGVINKSAGIFFWTLFMVRRLLKASDQGFSAEQMRTLLDSVPPSLEGLFEETLTSMEPDRQASIALLAPWVICALRPLTLYELYVALAFSADKPPLSLLDPKIRTGFDKERFRKYLIDVSGGIFETVPINGGNFVQVIHESVRDFFLGSEKAAKIMKLPVGKRFLEYGHERIVAASGHYFHIMELRRPLPLPEKSGYIAVEELVAMLYKPIMVPFEEFTLYGTTYFHDFVFDHIKEIIHSSGADFEGRDGPVTKCPRTILEGWLVFLYYLIIQTGALSSLQGKTLVLLHQNPSMICLSVPQFSRIATCINNLIIFVNKAMKDGFVLKEASGYRRSDLQIPADSSIYLRLFWNGALEDPLRKGLDFTNHYDLWNGPWEEYRKTMTLDRILELCTNDDTCLGLGFCLVAAKSRHLTDLEISWSQSQFPSRTVPLQDWQIVEKLDWRGLEHRGLSKISGTIPNSFHQDGSLGWSSIILKDLASPCSNPFLICGGTSDDGLELWLIDPREFKILALRKDWELKHYSLWSNYAEVATEGTAGI